MSLMSYAYCGLTYWRIWAKLKFPRGDVRKLNRSKRQETAFITT